LIKLIVLGTQIGVVCSVCDGRIRIIRGTYSPEKEVGLAVHFR